MELGPPGWTAAPRERSDGHLIECSGPDAGA
jgi:hypothetical protein